MAGPSVSTCRNVVEFRFNVLSDLSARFALVVGDGRAKQN